MEKHGVEILPFTGIRFHKNAGDISKLVAPPYDVFEYGDPLYNELKKEINSIVHIQKPEGEGDEKYFAAHRIFQEWISAGLMQADPEPGYYIYEQNSQLAGTRIGIIASIEIDENYRFIKRHEKIKSGPKMDRFKLTIATGLNIGLIFSIFKDPNGVVAQYLAKICETETPLYDFVWPAPGMQWNAQPVRNRLFRVKDEELQKKLGQRTLYIADGHHRYQTMVEYKKWQQAKGNDKANHTLMFIAPDANLKILGYNRVVKKIDRELVENFINKMSEDFQILEKKASTVLIPQNKGEFGVYANGFGYRIAVKNVGEKLDTEILQEGIFEPYLQISEDMVKSGEYITYPNGEENPTFIADMVDKKGYVIGFVLYPTGIDELMQVADANKILPQKSTYFYPKLMTGLVLNKVAEADNDLINL